MGESYVETFCKVDMARDLLISVVIPAYNCAVYLPAAIESALGQTYPTVEVIVVNDGSPDNTDEVVQPYLDRIIYFKQENRGLSAARNAGFRACHGEFICFLDADDILLPEKFERQLAVFEREPDLGVVISGYMDVEEDGKTEIIRVRKPWHRDALERMLNHEVFPPMTALIRRSVLEASPLFPEDIDTAESQEDWQLWLDFALNGVQFSAVPEPLALFRNRSGSIRQNPIKHLDGARRVVQWVRQHPRAQSYRTQVERLAAIVEMERVAAAWRVNRPDLAVENLVLAVSQWPQYWREPLTFLKLFERSLTVQENATWQQKPATVWFQRVICDGILALETPSLSVDEKKPTLAAANLMLSDIAYGIHDEKMRHKALGWAIRYSPRVCISPTGRSSLMRGIVGPRVGSWLTSFIRRWRSNNR
jgi:glycosyltransferase involved in cell wall biosynthesis